MLTNTARFKTLAFCASVAWLLTSCATNKAKEPESPEKLSKSLYEMGSGALMRGDFPQAIEDLRRSTVANPKNSRAHNNLGLAYLQMGQKDLARQEFETAVGIDNSPDAHINLGMMAEGAQKFPEARRNYQAAIDDLQYKTRHRALTNMAALELRQNNIDQARNLLYQSVQANPDYCLTHFLLGSIFMRENNARAGSEEFKKAVRAACVSNVEAHYQLAQAYLRLKDYPKARSELRILVEQFPETLQGQKAGDDLKLVP